MSVLGRFIMHYCIIKHQATVPRVAAAVPEDRHPSPNFGTAIPEYLQEVVDGLISQLQRSVMLQVKSITSLKCVKLSPRRDCSYFNLGNTMARRVWQCSFPGVSTLPCWLSSQTGALDILFFIWDVIKDGGEVHTSGRTY